MSVLPKTFRGRFILGLMGGGVILGIQAGPTRRDNDVASSRDTQPDTFRLECQPENLPVSKESGNTNAVC